MFQDTKVITPSVGETIRAGKFWLNSFEELARDLFCSLYKNDPQLKQQVPEGTHFNRKIIEEFMSDPQTELLRDYTVYDDFHAGCASVSLLKDIIQKIKENEDLQELAKMQNQIGSMPEGDAKEKAKKELEEKVEIYGVPIREIVKEAVDSAKKDAKEKNNIMDFFGCSKDTSDVKIKPEDKFNLLEEWERVKDMARYVGKYKQLAESSRFSNKRDKSVELCDITIGDDIVHSLPTEQLLMMNPTLKMEFFRRFTEKQLIQYNFRRDVPSGKGPIIALLDDSGSMYDSQRNAQKARGALFGLIEVAKKEKRDIGICIFSSHGEMSTFFIEKGKTNPDQILQILTVCYEGGTDFYGPIKWGLDLAKKSVFKEADIVMITDGECSISSDQKNTIDKLKKERELKISTILLGDGCYSIEEVESWSDEVYTDGEDNTYKSIYSSL